ncbi:hypothetical protein IG631_07712 [Alternaria alternata]|nr:hypothetical protein IG631_07712 [Alternaria alternata]
MEDDCVSLEAGHNGLFESAKQAARVGKVPGRLQLRVALQATSALRIAGLANQLCQVRGCRPIE